MTSLMTSLSFLHTFEIDSTLQAQQEQYQLPVVASIE